MARPFDVFPDSGRERRTVGFDVSIAALAARQHGVVSRGQLAALGLQSRAIDHRVERGRLHRVHRGVYSVGHRLLSRRGAWMAAVLVADGAVLSHRSAAALWEIHPSDRSRTDITVIRALRARRRLEIHRAALPPDEITERDGIPVTTPARTLLDLAAVLDRAHVERAATEAQIRRLTSPTSLAELVERYPNRAGTAALRRLLAAGTIGSAVTRKELELRFLAFLDAERLPRPRINATVELRPRPREVDCLWAAERLVVELDGFATHGTRAAFEDDRARDRALQTAGYRVLRVTWRQLANDAHTIAGQLRALLR